MLDKYLLGPDMGANMGGGKKVCWAAGNVDRGVRKRKREREMLMGT